MEETRRCRVCDKVKNIVSFTKDRKGGRLDICHRCREIIESGKKSDYEKQRASYIPEAIKYANSVMGAEPEQGTPERKQYDIDWDLIYLRRIVDICNEHGMGVTA